MKFKREISAGGIVFKKNSGQVTWLLVKLSRSKYWGFPKGHVGDVIKDETYEDAAHREVKEEGGIDSKIVNNKPIKKEYMFRQGDFLIKKAVYYFLMQYESGDIANHDWEVAEIKFVPEEEALATLSFKTDRDAFIKALSYFKLL